MSALVGMDFGTFQLLVNLVILVAVFAFDKWQIGLGTIINMVFVGYLIEAFHLGSTTCCPGSPRGW